MWETRSNQAGLTLLHHIVQTADEQKLKILQFTEEFDELPEAAKLSIEGLSQEVSALRKNFTLIASQLQNAPPDLLAKFEDPVVQCCDKVSELEKLVADIESKRVDLANYFCEDDSKFRTEDCFEIFNKLCSKVKDVEKENARRAEVEARRKKRLERQKQSSSSGLPPATGTSKSGPKSSRSKAPGTETSGEEPYILDQLLNEIGKGHFKLRRRPASGRSLV